MPPASVTPAFGAFGFAFDALASVPDALASTAACAPPPRDVREPSLEPGPTDTVVGLGELQATSASAKTTGAEIDLTAVDHIASIVLNISGSDRGTLAFRASSRP
jgi:hypothetical protein